ncbi:MAG: nucleotide exchange factor GrpE [Alphaproteobacteria bacterium]|nr:nucleotide exchange factor GrpE [Alphaproteobacteria bacterium]
MTNIPAELANEPFLARVIMNDTKPTETNDATPANFEPAANPEGGAQAPANETDSATVLENLRRENAELKDKMLRALAEAENQRRRAEREIADAKTYGVTSFARDMLTVADNLRRAAESAQNGTPELKNTELKTLIEGIELTEKDFLSRLGKYGIQKIDPLGAKFDPNRHEALYEIPSETAPNGTVVEVVEEGYAIGDRVLRPAKVGVARGSSKPANENAST